jgi:hypothetical protein
LDRLAALLGTPDHASDFDRTNTAGTLTQLDRESWRMFRWLPANPVITVRIEKHDGRIDSLRILDLSAAALATPNHYRRYVDVFRWLNFLRPRCQKNPKADRHADNYVRRDRVKQNLQDLAHSAVA